ncbi:DUF2787 family protein [Vibrio crassostreae]|uniref:DUF2787 family protein n=1 Tax=Vibrio crassostreae TaxID=246167 RepID=UPI0010E2DDB5|nr:DUF2787 family protein [Vibrio crassostreae]TCT63254.1 uncharacterized protein DUF2787 [Vibrio crassostreae]
MSTKLDALTKLNFQPDNINTAPFPTSSKLTEYLVSIVASHIEDNDALVDALNQNNNILLSFNDSTYSRKYGGWCPIEISIERESDGLWHYKYIFEGGFVPITYEFLKDGFWINGMEFNCYATYDNWEECFLSNVEMEVFDQVEVIHH